MTKDRKYTEITLSFIDRLFADYHPRDFAIRLWNGETYPPEDNRPARFTIVLNHPGALRRMFLPPGELALGEAYIYGDFDVEGNFEDMLKLADSMLELKWGPLKLLKQAWSLLRLPRNETADQYAPRLSGSQHSQKRDAQAIAYHYDLSNDFYKLWLDKNLVYSCGYFQTPDDDLDTAQEQKLDYLCRKLRLQPGERLLDIGCGWGGLIIHAAKYYGARTLGITLSKNQAQLARERIYNEGLDDLCQVEMRDYRELDTPESFDKIVSVGMVEHVGRKQIERYLQQAWKLLRPGGVFLNHGIAENPVFTTHRPDFTLRYVFPDGELIPIPEALSYAENLGWDIRDVENLREHYALTLNHWWKRLKAHKAEALEYIDEVTYRIWLIYLVGAEFSFRNRTNNLCQTLLAKPDGYDAGLPLTREDWYTEEHELVYG